MAKRSRLFWIIIAGIVIVVIIVAAVVFLNPLSKPVKTPAPELTVLPTPSVVPPTPQHAPLSSIVMNGGKVPGQETIAPAPRAGTPLPPG
jgi:flagellar basal body-associated protein FliL